MIKRALIIIHFSLTIIGIAVESFQTYFSYGITIPTILNRNGKLLYKLWVAIIFVRLRFYINLPLPLEAGDKHVLKLHTKDTSASKDYSNLIHSVAIKSFWTHPYYNTIFI